ncbi:hypothetical protein [Alloyangia pacifica]|uniref:hypothetical protein n=1 Tax=Alloyangia pacifica TaxID=311180 RepID=UPI000B83B62E|nr:hypothetical protein [Alloyangia pacifica]
MAPINHLGAVEAKEPVWRTMFDRHDVVAVVIGRNESARLRACVTSLQCEIARGIYVESGSDDGSQALVVAM